MDRLDRLSDADLLASNDRDAFAAFYRRHLPWVLHWLGSQVRDREIVADLAGEVFASASRARSRFDRRRAPDAQPWLQTIARNVLIDSLRRGRVEDRARRKLNVPPLALTEDDLARVDELLDLGCGDSRATAALASLPPNQAEAIRARVVEGADYEDIARRLRCSPAVVRQRVSRGLKAMRATLEGNT